ncbi:regulatory protein RecX [Agrobacterium rubi]|nr:regulatory protein RecX [Agrobacterium rubi]NTF24128.1 regulatory protein RecX [Agrobacterium rubi]
MTFVNEKSTLWAKRSAVYTLSQRAVSTEALRKKIVERATRKYDGIEQDEARQLADSAVVFCSEHGFLNDTLFAEYRVAEGVRKGHSKRKIAMTLKDKGIDREGAEVAVSDVEDIESAVNLARKKGYGPWRRVEADQKRLVKEISAFARNGFSAEIAWRVIRMSPEDGENQ